MPIGACNPVGSPKLWLQGLNIDPEIAQLFEGDLNPVAPKAQKKVPVPEGLNLDKWINKKPVVEDVMKAGDDMFSWMETVQVDESLFGPKAGAVEDPTALAKQKEQREAASSANPFHLGGGAVLSKKSSLVELGASEGVRQTSTLFWTISHAIFSSIPPTPRRTIYFWVLMLIGC